jgi:hypothetical protein
VTQSVDRPGFAGDLDQVLARRPFVEDTVRPVTAVLPGHAAHRIIVAYATIGLGHGEDGEQGVLREIGDVPDQ